MSSLWQTKFFPLKNIIQFFCHIFIVKEWLFAANNNNRLIGNYILCVYVQFVPFKIAPYMWVLTIQVPFNQPSSFFSSCYSQFVVASSGVESGGKRKLENWKIIMIQFVDCKTLAANNASNDDGQVGNSYGLLIESITRAGAVAAAVGGFRLSFQGNWIYQLSLLVDVLFAFLVNFNSTATDHHHTTPGVGG